MAAASGPSAEDAGALIKRMAGTLLAAFPGRLRSVYLLGSRADGRALPASDVDLGLVFAGLLGPAERDGIWDVVKGAGDSGPTIFDLTILDESDLRRGVRPATKHGKLLAGEDLLKDCPLLPAAELVAYFAYSALHNLWVIRGHPESLRFPLDFPAPEGEFRGYEQRGIWVGRDRFQPGFHQLVNLVTSIGSYRLASAGRFLPNKRAAAAAYAPQFPGPSEGPMLSELYLLCRESAGGAVPAAPGERAAIAAWCPQVLPFENAFLDEAIRRLPEFLRLEPPDLRGRLGRFGLRLASAAPEHAAPLAEAREIAIRFAAGR
ncbi:MAG TPA: nucleotidyltransferase domain-containing protein [Opitutaceae bacterium]|jgi:predicted nucleotidyltransferase|nr:nucleotidyltransferase domain-containing protein [Opitutaceae bacterium]